MPLQSLNQRSNGLLICWLIVLSFIPFLSINGRTLQYWVVENLGYGLAAWIIFISLVWAVAATLRLIFMNGWKMPFVHLLWFLPLFLIAPLMLGRVEERMHFLIFGAFGVLSMMLYRPRMAFALCLLVSVGDELLQYYLPDRVGDWRDVAINALASVAAAFFIWASIRTQRQSSQDESAP